MGWDTNFESGLLDDYDFTITDAKFAYDAGYANGQTLLLMLDGDTDDLNTPTTHVWFPLGKGWISSDGGKTVQHESGKDRNYNKSSKLAILINRCIEDFGIGDLLGERGSQFEAAPWVGLKFHLKTEKIGDYGNLEGAQQAKPFPVAFLGVVGEDATPKGNTAAQKVAAAKAKAEAKKSGSSIRDQVTAIFAKHDDFAAAQEEALVLDGVTEDPILDELMDETGLWQQVKSAA